MRVEVSTAVQGLGLHSSVLFHGHMAHRLLCLLSAWADTPRVIQFYQARAEVSRKCWDLVAWLMEMRIELVIWWLSL